MRVSAIIAEYNPLHNGHAYHIEETKKITHCDYLIVVMSGAFTQRGIPAIMPKHERAEAALTAGADLVIELPVTYATGSAERFAYGAVSLLHQLRCVDFLSFGCETNTIDALKGIAELLVNPPASFQNDLNHYLKEGYSYPRARQAVIDEYTDFNASLLETPNNILAIEYLKALLRLKSAISPIAIERAGAGYHDALLNSQGLSSASGIRNYLQSLPSASSDSLELMEILSQQMPASVASQISETYHTNWPIFQEDLSLLTNYSIEANKWNPDINIQDMSSDLWAKICKNTASYTCLNDFIALLNSKDMTYSRIARVLLHLVLNIPANLPDLCPYARVLGFRKDAGELMNVIKEQSHIPFITKVSEADSILEGDVLKMFHMDLSSAHIYNALVNEKYGTHLPDEYRTIIPII